jgi:hypothetical protein
MRGRVMQRDGATCGMPRNMKWQKQKNNMITNMACSWACLAWRPPCRFWCGEILQQRLRVTAGASLVN